MHRFPIHSSSFRATTLRGGPVGIARSSDCKNRSSTPIISPAPRPGSKFVVSREDEGYDSEAGGPNWESRLQDTNYSSAARSSWGFLKPGQRRRENLRRRELLRKLDPQL